MHEYFRLLVVEHKLVSYDYFMDEMQLYEIYDFLEVLPWSDKISYEQTRILMWASLKPYLKKKNITPEKLFPLYTDNETNVEKEPVLEEDEIIKLKDLVMKEWTSN